MDLSNRGLRNSFTSRCNYDCFMCHGEGVMGYPEYRGDFLNVDDYRFLYNVADKIGIRKSTFTGGEPLIRRNDLMQLLPIIATETNIEFSIVSNGSLMDKRFRETCFPLLRFVYISVHGYDSTSYNTIVRRSGMYEKAMKNLNEIREELYPNTRISLNTVVIEDDWKGQMDKHLSVYGDRFKIRFLEEYTMGKQPSVTQEEIIEYLISIGFEICDEGIKRTTLRKGHQEVDALKCFCAVASLQDDPVSFCHQYSNMFITPNGLLKPCMHLHDNVIPVIDIVKHRDESGLIEKINEAFEKTGENCPLVKQ